MKKFVFVIAILMIALFAFAGCKSDTPAQEAPPAATDTQTETPAAPEPASDDGIRIGFVMNSTAHPYTMALETFAKQKAAELGVEVTVVDAQMDAQKMVDMINQFVAQGYDAIMCSPVDVNSNLPAYKAAKEAGVFIVEVSGNSEGDTFDLVDAVVYADQHEEGRWAAEALVAVLPDGGNVVVLQGALGSSGQIGRDSGFDEYLADKPEYVILDRQTTDWMRDKAMSIMEDYLTRYNNIDAVYGHDDIMVAGAFEAIHAAGRTGIVSVAIGASADAVALIKAGDLTSTVDQPPNYEGSFGLELAYRLVKGEQVEKINHDVLGIVNADNVDSFTAVW